jgi:tRNA threonylcarbamoyladenosine biosynthesis protein TsaE
LHDADDSPITLQLADEAATAAFAAKLAQVLRPGLTIWLQGDLGAGKTTLVRALLHALGHRGRVKSPSYALVELYEAAGLHLRHFDLYRFRDASEWEAAGFRDEFNGCNVCLIEWPEKAQELLPQADLEIGFEILPDGRKVTLNANTTTGRECLGKLPN